MKKNEVKKLKTINFNHESAIWLNDLPHGRSVFVIKKGRKNRYFLEVEKTASSVNVERYDFKSVDFSKYEEESNLAFGIFGNLYAIDYDFIKNFDKICEAKKLLEKFRLIRFGGV